MDPVTGAKQDDLRRRLAQARARLEGAVPYSPDWDAAMAELEELERFLRQLDASPKERPVGAGAEAVA